MTQPIRVFHIISGFAIEGPLGGIERFGIELAQALDKTKVKPIVCGMWAYDTPYEQGWRDHLEQQRIPTLMPAQWDETSPYRSFMRTYQATRDLLQGETTALIHSHCQFGDILALLLRRQLGATVLLRTVHNEREWGKRPWRRLLLTGFLYPLWFDRELGVAQKVVDNLDQRPIARLIGKKAIRAYNALNLDRFDDLNLDVAAKQAKRAEMGIPAEAIVLGSVGRLTEQKGYSILLQAAKLVRETLPNAYVMLIGSGELVESLQQQARDLGITDHVLFTGPRPDVEELLAIMDMFVSSSLWEGLPTVLLESMAARVPLVATAVSGTTELIKDGKTGVLVAPNDALALAKGIVTLHNMDLAKKTALCRAAYQFARDNFSINSVARQHEELYQNLVSQ